MPVHLISLSFRRVVTFSINKVDVRGNTLGAESRENVIIEEATNNGDINGFWSKEEMLLV